MTQILRSTQKQPEGEKELHEKGSDLPTDTDSCGGELLLAGLT